MKNVLSLIVLIAFSSIILRAADTAPRIVVVELPSGGTDADYQRTLNRWLTDNPVEILSIAGVLYYREGLSQVVMSVRDSTTPSGLFTVQPTISSLTPTMIFTSIPRYSGGSRGFLCYQHR